PRNAPYQAYRARDRYFVIAAGNDKLWASVCDIVERPGLVSDPRFATVKDRAKNQVELAQLLTAIFDARDAADWLAAFERVGVPASLINSYSESLADPQVQANDWIRELRLPGGAVTRTFASPLAIGGRHLPLPKAPPRLDEDRAAILAMIGER
ncbi:MAG TPA: CoA transferase, partial [Micropepsaceae bacterium]